MRLEFVSYEAFSKNYEDVKRRVLAIDKMMNVLGYMLQIKLVDRLSKLISWYISKYLSNSLRRKSQND